MVPKITLIDGGSGFSCIGPSPLRVLDWRVPDIRRELPCKRYSPGVSMSLTLPSSAHCPGPRQKVVSSVGSTASDVIPNAAKEVRAWLIWWEAIPPRLDLRHSGLVPLWRQTEAKCSLRGNHIDEHERADLKLVGDGGTCALGKCSIASVCTQSAGSCRRRAPPGRLTDDSHVAGLEHDNQGK